MVTGASAGMFRVGLIFVDGPVMPCFSQVYEAMSLPIGNYCIYFERQGVVPNCR